uniref:Small ribosomal subunit protein uS4c n=1 Tax=Jenufa minuta TaxID=993092 RepID=A0A0S2LNH1_JENMI|nr:ribosomal protein S4 [Jenufa minuta]ALO62989.1 ribosomal protein S4 [Jenufa minuta]
MSRYLGPRLRIIRRIGKLRGFTRKKPFRRSFRGKGPFKGKILPPGQHGLTKLFKARESDYLIRLKIKQRLRFHYGLSEKQLRQYVRKAKKTKSATGQILLQLLEMRLDNIVFRLNMAPTIVAARQYISHGHIYVNNKKVNIPSYSCKPKDIISAAMTEKSLKLIQQNLKIASNQMSFYKKRLKKTLAFVLYQLNIVPNITSALLLISQGYVKINNKKILSPQRLCYSKEVLTITTPESSRQIKLQFD